jgi:stage II sporulation protein D (peptidoglycan lytic transglycosylase)
VDVRRSSFTLIVAVLLSACGGPPARVELPDEMPERLASVRVQVRANGTLVVRDVPLEDYVTATILSEVDPPTADPRVLERMYEVQAIISRTYARAYRGRHAREGFDLCSTTHCQLYEPARVRRSRWTDLAQQAAARTRGELLWFSRAPARTLFHADCGGHTSNATSVWGGTSPAYLSGTLDAGPARHAHMEWTFDTRVPSLHDALNGDSRTAVGSNLIAIDIAARDSAGRAERMTLRGSRSVEVRGEIFREVVTRALGVQTLRSTLFTVRPAGDHVVFTGRGFGHGVGLCQAGALARLKAGMPPDKVLAFYFPGTQVKKLPVASFQPTASLPLLALIMEMDGPGALGR